MASKRPPNRTETTPSGFEIAYWDDLRCGVLPFLQFDNRHKFIFFELGNLTYDVFRLVGITEVDCVTEWRKPAIRSV